MGIQDNLNEIMKLLFTIQITNKMYHLTTNSFARHKASDSFDELLQAHIDKFAETFIGRYQIKPVVTSIRIDQNYISDNGIVLLYTQAKTYFENLNKKISDSELLNIRDELLADINKTLYLFQLN